MKAHHMACLLGAFLLAAIPGTAQTVTSATVTEAGATRAATTSTGEVVAEDTTTYAADFEESADEYLVTGNILHAWDGWPTVSVWFKKESTIKTLTLIQKGTGNLIADYEFEIKLGSTGTVVYTGSTGAAAKSCTINLPLVVGVWYHFLVQLDTGVPEIDCYLGDGSTHVNGSNTPGADMHEVNSPIYVGSDHNAANLHYDGLVSRIAMWDRKEFSGAELITLYNGGTPIPCGDLAGAGLETNLYACWMLDEEAGLTRAESGAGSCGVTCDLTDVNTVERVEVTYP